MLYTTAIELLSITAYTPPTHTPRFHNNSSPSTGGGLQLTFLQEGRQGSDNSVIVTDTQFTSNSADYGGGVYFLPLGEHY